MKREEKNQNSKRKIIDSALRAFASKGYGLRSINTICSKGGISKGVLYHYFKEKDDIYPACVKECFDALTAYLHKHIEEENPTDAQAYFDARLSFFKENPQFQRLFPRP